MEMKKVFELQIRREDWEIILECPKGKRIVINTDVSPSLQFPEDCRWCREFQTCLRAVSK